MRLSELIKGALQQLEAFEGAENTKVNMNIWVRQTRHGPCFACLGGIWVLSQAGVKDFRHRDSVIKSYREALEVKETKRQEMALEEVRSGEFCEAHRTLTGNYDPELHRFDREITPYDKNPKEFKLQLMQVAEALQEEGL